MRSLPGSWSRTLSALGFSRGRVRRGRSALAKGRRLAVESLEPRQMLSITVTTLADELGGTGNLSLREALQQAASNSGPDTIDFDPALFATGPATIALTYDGADPGSVADPLLINSDVTIEAPGADLLTIDAGGLGVHVITVASGTEVTLRGLTITGGEGGGSYGTGIDSLADSLTIDLCVITENHGYGVGGVYQSGGSLVVTNSVVAFNNVGNYMAGGIVVTGGTLLLENSTVADNVTGSHGGGIRLEYATATIKNSTISGNTAGGNGGGIYATGSSLSISSSTITNNYATYYGGGIYSYDGATVNNTIITGNTTSQGTDNIYGSISGQYNLTWGDAGLAPLADHGGLVPTHALLPTSPAIDAGDPSALAGQNGIPEFDTRGGGYSRVLAGRIDIGATDAHVIKRSSGNKVEVYGTLLGDTITVNSGNVVIDTIGTFTVSAGTASSLEVHGLDGSDTITISPAIAVSSSIYGGEGNDSLTGGSGSDSVYGGNGNDVLMGGDGTDSLYGGEGDDLLYGNGGTNLLYGEAGSDAYFAESGAAANVFYEGAGDDRYVFKSGDLSTVILSPDPNSTPGGSDTLDFSEMSGEINLSIASQSWQYMPGDLLDLLLQSGVNIEKCSRYRLQRHHYRQLLRQLHHGRRRR
jgi:CSLREA domain-containing protein